MHAYLTFQKGLALGLGTDGTSRPLRFGALLKLVLGVLMGAALLSPARAATDEELLRAVADKALASAHRKDATGKTLPAFNGLHGWYYQSHLLYEGLTRLGDVLRDDRYGRFRERRIDELTEVLPGSSPGSHTAFYFNLREVWMTGLSSEWMARATKDRPDVYQDFTRRFTDFVTKQTRVDGGIIANLGSQVRTDDAYLLFRPLLEISRIEQDTRWRDEAINQILATHKLLFVDADGLYCHAWDARKRAFSRTYWGRGNAWMALAHVDLLGTLAIDDPRRPGALAAFRAQVAGLRRWQAPDGGWRQVLDAPESWVETSATAMFVYAIARGVRENWLDTTELPLAQNGWAAIRSNIAPSGSIVDICPGTGPGDRNFYLNRPRERDNSHGHGPVLLAGAEMLRLAGSPR